MMQPTDKNGKHRNVLDRSGISNLIAVVSRNILTLVMWVVFTLEDLWKQMDLLLILAMFVYIQANNTVDAAAMLQGATRFSTAFPNLAWMTTAYPFLAWMTAALALFTVKCFLLTGAMQILASSLNGLRKTHKYQFLLTT